MVFCGSISYFFRFRLSLSTMNSMHSRVRALNVAHIIYISNIETHKHVHTKQNVIRIVDLGSPFSFSLLYFIRWIIEQCFFRSVCSVFKRSWLSGSALLLLLLFLYIRVFFVSSYPSAHFISVFYACSVCA